MWNISSKKLGIRNKAVLQGKESNSQKPKFSSRLKDFFKWTAPTEKAQSVEKGKFSGLI